MEKKTISSQLQKLKKTFHKPKTDKRKIRYAVVGLGHIAQVAVLPAFAHAKKNSELVSLISNDPEKLKKLGKKYQVASTGSYEDFEDILIRDRIDAVYIALPNDQHCEYTERAAALGVHVLCEKPMGLTEAECERMMQATTQRNVKLMVAYRLHFESANLKAIDVVQKGKLGEPRIFNSLFGYNIQDSDNIRLKAIHGGGTLWDIGIYCINAARYLFRCEPIEVFAFSANNGDPKFREVDEMTSAILRFPGERLATFTCSFGSAGTAKYDIVGTKGSLTVDSAYEYVEEITHTLVIDDKKTTQKFAKKDQFAAELLYFSDCILNDKQPEPSGLEGLADVRVIHALHESLAKGQPVWVEQTKKETHPEASQKITRPPVKKPVTIHVSSPSGD